MNAEQDPPEKSSPQPGSVRSNVVWLIGELRRVIGTTRMVRISFEAFIASSAISIMSFATLFAIRAAANDSSFGALPSPDVPIWLFLTLVVVAGVVGAGAFLLSERHTNQAALEFGAELRREMSNRMLDSESAGWQTSLEERPSVLSNQVLVHSVREISIASREIIRLIGPASMALIGLVALGLLEPVVTLLLVPSAVALGLVVLTQQRRVESLNDSFQRSVVETRTDVGPGLEQALIGESANFQAGLSSARRADEAIFDQMLEPVRTRAAGVVGMAVMGSLILGAFLWRAPSGQDIDGFRVILYLIMTRLTLNAAVRFGSSILNVSRRTAGIRRFREIAGLIDQYEPVQIDLSDSASVTPTSVPPFAIEFSGGAVEVSPDGLIYVVAERIPDHSVASAFVEALRSRAGLDESHRIAHAIEMQTTNPYPDWVVGSSITSRVEIEMLDEQETRQTSCFVLARLGHEPWADTLDSAPENLMGMFALRDGKIVDGGPTSWARDNRHLLRNALGFGQPVPSHTAPEPRNDVAPATPNGTAKNAE